jgi:hypothetical protein
MKSATKNIRFKFLISYASAMKKSLLITGFFPRIEEENY